MASQGVVGDVEEYWNDPYLDIGWNTSKLMYKRLYSFKDLDVGVAHAGYSSDFTS